MQIYFRYSNNTAMEFRDNTLSVTLSRVDFSSKIIKLKALIKRHCTRRISTPRKDEISDSN